MRRRHRRYLIAAGTIGFVAGFLHGFLLGSDLPPDPADRTWRPPRPSPHAPAGPYVPPRP